MLGRGTQNAIVPRCIRYDQLAIFGRDQSLGNSSLAHFLQQALNWQLSVPFRTRGAVAVYDHGANYQEADAERQ
jgi:hypothetical protein